MSIMYAHLHTQPESVCEQKPDLPARVDVSLRRALAKKPEERFSSIAEFAREFREALGITVLSRLDPSSPAPLPRVPNLQSGQTLPTAPLNRLVQDKLALLPGVLLDEKPDQSTSQTAKLTSSQPQRRQISLALILLTSILLLFLIGGSVGATALNNRHSAQAIATAGAITTALAQKSWDAATVGAIAAQES